MSGRIDQHPFRCGPPWCNGSTTAFGAVRSRFESWRRSWEYSLAGDPLDGSLLLPRFAGDRTPHVAQLGSTSGGAVMGPFFETVATVFEVVGVGAMVVGFLVAAVLGIRSWTTTRNG